MSWLAYALLSAVFAALTAILAKIGIKNVDSNLATAIRTVVILVFAWGIVFWQGTFNKNFLYFSIFLSVFNTFRYCHRAFLAFLFPGFANG